MDPEMAPKKTGIIPQKRYRISQEVGRKLRSTKQLTTELSGVDAGNGSLEERES